MGFWIFMFIMVELIPLSMYGFGYVFKNIEFKTINYFFGYRTKRSMKTQESWIYAQKLFGEIWYKWGKIMIFISIIPMLFVINKDNDLISLVAGIETFIQMIPMCAVYFIVEKKLKSKFDN